MISILAPFFEHNKISVVSKSTILIWNTKSLRRYELYCNYSGLDDASVVELVTALGRFVNLKDMNLGLAFNNSNGSTWCAALAKLLENPTMSKLEDLALGHNYICDTGLAILANGLVHNNSKVKKLSLEVNDSITVTDWVVFSECLESSTCSLEFLDLSGYDIDDEGLIVLRNALATNKSFKILHLVHNAFVSDDGWRMFFLKHSRCFSSLETLALDQNTIRDEGTSALGNALTGFRAWLHICNHLNNKPPCELTILHDIAN